MHCVVKAVGAAASFTCMFSCILNADSQGDTARLAERS